MKAQVMKSFKARYKGQVVEHSPGEKLQVNIKVAQPLINKGFIRLLESLDKGEKPIATKIYSKILQDVVWLALDPTFTGDGDGIPVYSIEELRMMRGADAHTMRLIHTCKKELGGTLTEARELKQLEPAKKKGVRDGR